MVAVSTPPGRGGIACLRLSGERAGEVAGRIFRPAARAGGPRPGGPPAFGRFLDRGGTPLDHGFLVLFRPEAAFTGESTAELWTHGSPAVLAELLDAACAAGAEAAGPGEFTYRAVRNGRIDLTRAEAIRDLIDARTAHQARIAFAQAEGAVARHVAPLRERLEEWIARGEAAVEFVDEAETHLERGRFRDAISRIASDCRELLDGFRRGRVFRDGASLAIVGRPNVGKSSLFNRLLARERAIVTEVAGTTRDTLEEHLDIGGVPVRLVDTAGLRSVDDPIESEGVRRAHVARAAADLVLLVLDGSRAPEADELEALRRIEAGGERPTLVVANKSDLVAAPDPALSAVRGLLAVSALSGDGIAELCARLRDEIVGTSVVEDPIVTDSRHATALERAEAWLNRAVEAVDRGLSEELVLEDLRAAIRELGEIGGEFTDEALYDRIFSTFCIGK
ncbi:MAG TPA: tRNA uridine-5-carboxymethylaminomethyl(34) synthesis GTPase MnmE [Candidatus Polarisedimenticolaceae bacterium]|nr:tRNA uridine-5-carboxymethylaminomethyl(34) synthesis GTPase MnmE [Candidatus Polarisedimenticolaceae bacterium]